MANIQCNLAIFDSILCRNGTEHVSLGNAFVIGMLYFFRPAVYLRCDWKWQNLHHDGLPGGGRPPPPLSGHSLQQHRTFSGQEICKASIRSNSPIHLEFSHQNNRYLNKYFCPHSQLSLVETVSGV